MKAQGYNSDGELIRDVYVEHRDYDLFCDDDGMTRQEFKDECDINVLLRGYEKQAMFGVLPPGLAVNSLQGQYLDVSEVPDLMGALRQVELAETHFMRLPARVRQEFDNDPVRFVEYAADPQNLARMREWGLAPPAPPASEGAAGAAPEAAGGASGK